MGLLEGKVALVTGGTSGIGRASAVLFAQERAKVALTGRRAAQGNAVVAAIEAAGGEALFIQADLTEIGGIPALIENVGARYGRLDCAFNNAGVSGGGPIETLDEPAWDTVIDTNLKAQVFCLNAQAAQMKKHGNGGSIVFTGSVLASIALPGTNIYSASKGGIVSLAPAAAGGLGSFGIRVKSLNPSITPRRMNQGLIVQKADRAGRQPHAI